MTRDFVVMLYLLTGSAFAAVGMGLTTFSASRPMTYSLSAAACIVVMAVGYLSFRKCDEVRSALIHLSAGWSATGFGGEESIAEIRTASERELRK